MPSLSVNGLLVNYVFEEISSNRYKLQFTSAETTNLNPVSENNTVLIKMTVNGRVFINFRSSATDTESLSNALVHSVDEFNNTSDDFRTITYTRVDHEHLAVITLSVFGKTEYRTVAVPKLAEQPVTSGGMIELNGIVVKKNVVVKNNNDPDFASEHPSTTKSYFYRVYYSMKTVYNETTIEITDMLKYGPTSHDGVPNIVLKIDGSVVYDDSPVSSSDVRLENCIKTVSRNRTVQKIPIEAIAKWEDVTVTYEFKITNTGGNSSQATGKVEIDESTSTENKTKTKTIKVSVPKLTSIKNRYVDISSVNNGKTYLVNESALEKYGRIEAMVDFSDAETPSVLKELALLYLNSMQFDDLSINVTINDLHLLNSSVDNIDLLDKVLCISKPHGINRTFLVSEVTIPLDDPTQIQYTLGKKSSGAGLSSQSINNKTDFTKKTGFIPEISQTIEYAQRNLSSRLGQMLNGYVSVIQENDTSQALIISDNDDWAQSAKMWKWDMNGLGYSNSTQEDEGYSELSSLDNDGRWYRYGFTMDGTIVANLIQTGKIEDNEHINYWNLNTGEFSLGLNTKITGLEYEKTLGELIDDVNRARGSRYGSSNLLNGTLYMDRISKSQVYMSTNFKPIWTNSAWQYIMHVRDTSNGVLSPIISVVSDPVPNQLKTARSVVLKFPANTAVGSYVSLHQEEIPMYSNAIHAIGVYILPEVKCKVSIKLESYNNTELVLSKTIPASTDWKVCKLLVSTNETEPEHVTLQDGLLKRITFIYEICNTLGSSASSSKKITIAGMSLVAGTTPTDVIESKYDKHRNMLSLVEDIQEGNLHWTKEQMLAWSNGLKQETVFNRLVTRPDGKKTKAITLDEHGNLYINATMIKAGTFNANIIKTQGTIADHDQNGKRHNWWNFTTGQLTTKRLESVDGVLEGQLLTTSSGAKNYAAISGGTIKFYSYNANKTKTHTNGYITMASNTRNLPTGTTRDLIIANPVGKIEIDARHTVPDLPIYSRTITTYTKQASKWKKVSVKTELNRYPEDYACGRYDRSRIERAIIDCVDYNNGKPVYYIVRLDFCHGLLVNVSVGSRKGRGNGHWSYSVTHPQNRMISTGVYSCYEEYFLHAPYYEDGHVHYENDFPEWYTSGLELIPVSQSDIVKGNTRTISYSEIKLASNGPVVPSSPGYGYNSYSYWVPARK